MADRRKRSRSKGELLMFGWEPVGRTAPLGRDDWSRKFTEVYGWALGEIGKEEKSGGVLGEVLATCF